MTRRASKVAVSLPPDLFRAVEHVRKHAGLSRSAVVQEALRLWLDRQQEEARVRQYIEGYRARPETSGEIEQAEATAVRLLATEDW